MVEGMTSYLYRGYTITAFREDGVWWAKARVAEKDAGGDRAVVGGPWRTRPAAQAAAEAFCQNKQAGQGRNGPI
jgi:hypothetical protein